MPKIFDIFQNLLKKEITIACMRIPGHEGPVLIKLQIIFQRPPGLKMEPASKKFETATRGTPNTEIDSCKTEVDASPKDLEIIEEMDKPSKRHYVYYPLQTEDMTL